MLTTVPIKKSCEEQHSEQGFKDGEKEIGKGGDRKNSSEMFVVGHSFKSLIKENNFAVWRNEEGERREGGGNGRALFFSDFVSWNSFRTLKLLLLH